MKVNSKQKHASSRNDSAGWQDLDVKPNIEDLCIKTAQIQKGTLEFNKIEFGRQTEDEKAKFKKKRKLSRDPFKALSKLEETKDRIKRLEEQGKLHIAESIVNRRAWQAALLKSEGLKVMYNYVCKVRIYCWEEYLSRTKLSKYQKFNFSGIL